MTPLRIPLRAVFYKEGDVWVAHCLEFDLLGHGSTKKKALALLAKAIGVQIEASIKHNNLANLFTPAEGEYFRMFAAGKDVAVGKLEIAPVDSVTIEDFTTREYAEPELAHS
jgi:hypothetical protein